MANNRQYLTALLVFSLAHLPTCTARLSDVFDRFFANYNDGFQTILRNNCSDSYNQYLLDSGGDNSVFIGGYSGFGDVGTANIVVNCILGQTPEIIKAKLASAQIILGLTPSLLASVGVRPQDTAILAVLGKKPFLAGLLAAGSPAVFAHRASEYALAISELHEPGLSGRVQFRSRALRTVLDVFIYAIAGASAANVAVLAWELADKVPFAITPDQAYLPFLWVYLGTIIHVLAAVALWILVEVESTTDEDIDQPLQHQTHVRKGSQAKVWSRAVSHIKHALGVDDGGNQGDIRVLILPASIRFYTLSWVTSVFTTCHILFGSLLFASALFISIDDALVVIVRFLASAIVCRILLKIEIILLRAHVNIDKKGEER